MKFSPRRHILHAVVPTALVLGSSLGAQGGNRIPDDKVVLDHPAGVSYSILQEGTGSTKPLPGDEALIQFTEWLNDGTVINTSRERSEPYRMRVGDPRLPLGINIGVQVLTQGGRAKVTVPPNNAYGPAGIPGKVPPDSTMVYEVELVEYIYRPKPAEFRAGDPEKAKTIGSGLKYEVLQPGSGEKPVPGQLVEIEFTVWSTVGDLLDGTHRMGRSAKIVLTSAHAALFRQTLPVMTKGETWRVEVPASLSLPVNATDEQKTQAKDTVWQIQVIDIQDTERAPPGDEDATTTTPSGLQFQRLSEGTGDRPRGNTSCELDWAVWKLEDGMYVDGTQMQGTNMRVLLGQSPHKFLDEIVRKMQIGEEMRVEVPANQTTPKMLLFDTVWRLKLVATKELPSFELPTNEELTATPSGLRYKILRKSDAAESTRPKPGDQVRVHYVGWLTNGTPFDSSYTRDEPFVFMVGGRVIPGWNEGIQLMSPGDSFLFVVPSSLAYGARGTPGGPIPPDATLVFNIELLDGGK